MWRPLSTYTSDKRGRVKSTFLIVPSKQVLLAFHYSLTCFQGLDELGIETLYTVAYTELSIEETCFRTSNDLNLVPPPSRFED